MKIRPVRAIAILVFLAGAINLSLAVHRSYVHVGHVQTGVQMAEMNLGVQQYAQDHNGMLPVATNETALAASLAPYRVGPTPYRAYYDNSVAIIYNYAISGRNIHKIKSPGATVTFYESKPDFEGKRWVTYLGLPASPAPSSAMEDQYARLVTEQQWQTIQKSMR